MDYPKEKTRQRTHTNIQPIKSLKNMKTSLQILLVLMAIMAVWSACQFDVVNAVLAFVSLPFLFIFLMMLKMNEER